MVSTGKDFLKGNDKDGETRKNAKLRKEGIPGSKERKTGEMRNGETERAGRFRWGRMKREKAEDGR